MRSARADELADVGALTVAAYEVDGHLDGDPDEVGYRAELADAARRAELAEVWVAAEDGELLGTVTVAEAGTPFAEVAAPGELEFRMLGVAAVGRGRGVGQALVRAVLGRATERGCSAVVISTMDGMAAAHRLYEREGFAPLPERDWEPIAGLVLRVLRCPIERGAPG